MPVFSEVTPVDSMALTQHGAAKPALASDNQLYLQTPRKSAQRTQLQLLAQSVTAQGWRSLVIADLGYHLD